MRWSPPLRPLAAAAASAVGLARVSRLRGPGVCRVQVRVGPDGILVASSDDEDTVGEVALQAPSATCRTLWRLLHLGPRSRPPGRRDLEPLLAGRLVDAVSEDTADLRQLLGAEPGTAVLDRVELRTAAPDARPAGLALLDTPSGCWRLRGPDESLTLRPTDAIEILDVLAGWQLALVGPDGDDLARPAPPAPLRAVEIDGVAVHVPVPDAWELLTPVLGLSLLARQREGSGFRVNVTATPEPSPPDRREPGAVASELAAGLDGGVAIDAWDEPEGGMSAVVVHAAPATDVVTLQRRLPAAAVSYTCAVTQWPSWSVVLRRWASRVTLTPPPAGSARS